ncbi:MAG: transposase family protein [Nitrospirae bacterium]|nr:transposase family protein [Nitrospirota bacterium]
MNLIWGVDLTGKTDAFGNLYNILGIFEHKSRVSLGLTALKDKASITILRCLFDVVELYGKPKSLRTDNEPVFTSWIFRLSLWFMDIRHQRIDKSCPWQNGRIERFFGTLKEKLDQWNVIGMEQLNNALAQFRFWYNHVRPHQYLDGRTPAEVWNGTDVFTKGHKEIITN